MAKCKICKSSIPDGQEFCDKCKDKNKADEAYLDSLLSSVKTIDTEPSSTELKNKIISSEQTSPDEDAVGQQEETLGSLEEGQESLQEQSDGNNEKTKYQSESSLDEVIIDDNIEPYEESGSDDFFSQLDEDTITTGEVKDIEENNTQPIDIDEDFADMLGQLNQDDPLASDIQAISEMLAGNNPLDIETNEEPLDVGDVFSDALKVVTSLEDPNIEEEFDAETNSRIKQKDNKKKHKKDKKIKKKNMVESKDKSLSVEEEGRTIVVSDKQNDKKGILRRIFGNIPEAKTKGSISESAATKEIGRGKKIKKGNKGKGTDTEAISDDKQGTDSIDDNEKQQGIARKPSKKEKREEKKEKKKKKKEVSKVIDEIEEDEGRINRVGASIIFILFGIFVILLLIGTNIFSYTVSVRNAEKYFNNNKYTKAYNEVYGIEWKPEDYELYQKITTVMFVNKQLNSYNNYYYMGKYPEALDSLLKGLQKYDKYIEFATIIGVDNDLDYVRDQIISELDYVFGLSENKAEELVNCESQIDYSIGIYDVVLENANVNDISFDKN